jgi:hypothetical protein
MEYLCIESSGSYLKRMPLACFALPGSQKKYETFQWKFLTCDMCGTRGLGTHFPEYSHYKQMCLRCRCKKAEKYRPRTESGTLEYGDIMM